MNEEIVRERLDSCPKCGIFAMIDPCAKCVALEKENEEVAKEALLKSPIYKIMKEASKRIFNTE